MALFDKKEKISRKEFRDIFRKKNPILPGTGRKLIGLPERTKIEEKLFGRAPIAFTSKEKYERLVFRMRVEKYKVPGPTQKQLIDKKIRFLKKLGGV
jgi:hypothetical protein